MADVVWPFKNQTMKKILLLCISTMLVGIYGFCQKKDKQTPPEPYNFKTIIENPITSVKNQASSGTCWCFSGISFIESEIIRATGKECDLSEMFVVSNAYYDKAVKYIRLHGNLNFSPGSSFSDVLAVLDTYGIVPDTIMPGLNYGTPQHVHFEMDEVLKAIVTALIKNPNQRLTKSWKQGFKSMVAAYLGEIPESFSMDGQKYTPKSYMESLGINIGDYIDISSWTHHPFYETMTIEVPDNWRAQTAWNVPLDDLIAIIDNALENGYTVAWASDVSEDGFTATGVGVVPDIEKINVGSDQARWIGNGNSSREVPIFAQTPCPEIVVTQEMRQEAFDDYSTTDDHGMHIYGLAKDQNGTEYYMVKNSWGKVGPYDGIWYVSKEFVRYKTTDIVVNKHAIPAEITNKMKL